MSAIKAIQDFIEKKGEQAGNEKIFIFDTPIECDYFNILSIINGDKGMEYAVESDGYYFRNILDEYYAFVILKHLSETDEYRDEIKFALPLNSYEEFNYKTFCKGIRNLKSAIGYIEKLVDLERPLNNKEWSLPTLALNMIMNDIQHYNRFIEEKK